MKPVLFGYLLRVFEISENCCDSTPDKCRIPMKQENYSTAAAIRRTSSTVYKDKLTSL